MAFLPQYKRNRLSDFFPYIKISVGVVSFRDRIRDSTRDLLRNMSRNSFRNCSRIYLVIRPQTPSKTFAKIITQIPKGFFFNLAKVCTASFSKSCFRNFIQGLLKFHNVFVFLLWMDEFLQVQFQKFVQGLIQKTLQE